MQAEGGFGRRQFDIGCLDSMIEFGPQSVHRHKNKLSLRLKSLKASMLEQIKVVFLVHEVTRRHRRFFQNRSSRRDAIGAPSTVSASFKPERATSRDGARCSGVMDRL